MSQIGLPYPPGYRNPNPSTNGSAPTSTRKKPDRSKDYVSAVRSTPAGLPRVLDGFIDDVLRCQGPFTYDAMDLDPACRSAKEALILSILAGGMDLAPADAPKPGTKDEARTPDQAKAAEYVDEAWRHVERIEDFEAVLRDVLEATKDGVRLARPVLELAGDGPDKGKLVLKSLTVKPRDAWKFVVDDFLNVTEIEAVYGPDGQRVRYPADEFLWLTWEMRGNDPRGNSEYRAANESWNMKYLAYPEYRLYLHQFASGMIVGFTAPAEVDRAEVDPVTGQATGETVTAQQHQAQELGGLGNGRCASFPNGAAVEVHFPSGDGSAFLSGFDFFDRQIHLAILGTTSATLEAQHDSRAKGETGQDILGMKVERGRKALAAFVRRLLRLILTLNHGEDGARLTPLVTFGQTDPQNRAELWGAAASMGMQITPSMVPEVCQIVGLPQPDMEADEQKAREAADEAMERQAALKPPGDGGKPGDGAPPPGGGAKPKPKGKAAEFAYGTPIAPPWHDADLLEAERIVRSLFPSAAAMKRWEKGTETPANLRAILGMIAADATRRMVADAEALMREIATVDPAAPAEFASPFETVSRWRDGAAQLLRRAFLAGSLALMGPRDLSADEWAALHRANEEQVGYLDGFAGAILAGTQPRDGTLPARAGLYGGAIWGVAQNVSVQRAVADGKTQYRSVHEGPDAPCAVCKRENAKGWVRIGTLIPIGGRACMANDHCYWEFR